MSRGVPGAGGRRPEKSRGSGSRSRFQPNFDPVRHSVGACAPHPRLLVRMTVPSFFTASARNPIAFQRPLVCFPRMNSEFVLIQFCESDQTPLPSAQEGAYQECFRRHVAMARKIGAIPILVAPIRMRAYTPANLRRHSVLPYVVVMQQVALEMEASFVDLRTQGGSLARFVGRELSKQLRGAPGSFLYYDELGVKGLLSWWRARAGDPSALGGSLK